jgi:hypothetical protein
MSVYRPKFPNVWRDLAERPYANLLGSSGAARGRRSPTP